MAILEPDAYRLIRNPNFVRIYDAEPLAGRSWFGNLSPSERPWCWTWFPYRAFTDGPNLSDPDDACAIPDEIFDLMPHESVVRPDGQILFSDQSIKRFRTRPRAILALSRAALLFCQRKHGTANL